MCPPVTFDLSPVLKIDDGPRFGPLAARNAPGWVFVRLLSFRGSCALKTGKTGRSRSFVFTVWIRTGSLCPLFAVLMCDKSPAASCGLDSGPSWRLLPVGWVLVHLLRFRALNRRKSPQIGNAQKKRESVPLVVFFFQSSIGTVCFAFS